MSAVDIDVEPCVHGHPPGRYKSGHCVTCRREDRKRRYYANPEYEAEYRAKYNSEHPGWWNRTPSADPELRAARARAYYEKNSAKILAQTRAYAVAHPEVARAKVKRWRVKNPHAVRAQEHRYRARELAALGSHTGEELAELYARQKNRCADCGKTTKLTADHVVPLFLGGSDYIFNIIGRCWSCNSRKGSRLLKGTRFSLFDNPAVYEEKVSSRLSQNAPG